jgi:hypothetical protein
MVTQTAKRLDKKPIGMGQCKPRLKELPLCEQYREEGKWAVCGHADVPSNERYLRELESVLMRRAEANPNLGCVITTGDKESLNNINKTGDFSGAGNASVKLVQDIKKESMLRAYERICGRPYLIRKNGGSDETAELSAGDYSELLRMIMTRPEVFFETLERVRADYTKRLSEYKYKARKLRLCARPGEPEVEEVGLDLERYSRALINPMLVSAAHIGSPRVLRIADQSPGFIERTMADIDAEELLAIQSLLPPAFSPNLGPVPEFPAKAFDAMQGFALAGSSAIEIKFRHVDQFSRFYPLRVIGLSKKGIAEIMSGDVGLRYINTFYGKHVADHILSSVAHAMSRIGNELQMVRRTESNLIYVVENSDHQRIASRVSRMISARFREAGLEHVGLRPSICAIRSEDVHVNDLRSSLALKRMGMIAKPEVMTYTDLLIAAVKIIDPLIIDEALERSASSSIQPGKQVIQTIKDQLAKEPAVRDTEDMVYRIRGSKEDPRLEKSVWEYALNWGKEFRNRLIDVIESL